MILKPQKISAQKKIITVATSCWIEPELIEKAQQRFQQHGLSLTIHPQTQLRQRQQAGTHQQRAQALNESFADPDIGAIWITAGGDRALHVLDFIDYDLIRKNPKPIIGFSDATAVLAALYKNSDLTTFHGPDIARLSGEKLDPISIAQCFSLMQGKDQSIDLDNAIILKNQKNNSAVQGRLLGGNLTIFTNLMGTDYIADLSEHILFLEDEYEPLWNIDRMFLQLKRAKGFDNVKAIILGQFKEATDKINNSGVSFGYSVEELILEHTSHLNIPILSNAPFGHLAELKTFPIGAQAKLILGKKSKLVFEDSIFE